MKPPALLTTASLLTVLFVTLHLTGDILFRISPAGLANLIAVFVLAGIVCGTLLFAGRRAGYLSTFLGSLLGLLMPVLHMQGPRGMIGREMGNSGQAFLFVWVLLALGITSTVSLVLSARALWSLPWRRVRRASTAA